VAFRTRVVMRKIPEADWPAERERFLSHETPRLRVSALAKRYGWGIHVDSQERVALVRSTPASPATLERVDEETRRIVEEAEDEVTGLLERERGRLDALARALLEQETLDQADAYRIAGVEEPALEPEEEARAAPFSR
jgi:hypothetical protein